MSEVFYGRCPDCGGLTYTTDLELVADAVCFVCEEENRHDSYPRVRIDELGVPLGEEVR